MKMIPPRKRASATGYVGVDDPKAWISCPTEWSRYTLKTSARERRTLVMPPFNVIQYKTHNHK
uniref:Uncharacterized protein n=1 Tax=Oryza meridionalis TaxID=40149 RepID=A0A0E0BW33_9ORYZ